MESFLSFNLGDLVGWVLALTGIALVIPTLVAATTVRKAVGTVSTVIHEHYACNQALSTLQKLQTHWRTILDLHDRGDWAKLRKAYERIRRVLKELETTCEVVPGDLHAAASSMYSGAVRLHEAVEQFAQQGTGRTPGSLSNAASLKISAQLLSDDTTSLAVRVARYISPGVVDGVR
jgi:hypothetical protein